MSRQQFCLPRPHHLQHLYLKPRNGIYVRPNRQKLYFKQKILNIKKP